MNETSVDGLSLDPEASFHFVSTKQMVIKRDCVCVAGLTGRCPAVRRTTSWTRLRPSSTSCEALRRPSAQARRRGRTSSRWGSPPHPTICTSLLKQKELGKILCWPLVSVNIYCSATSQCRVLTKQICRHVNHWPHCGFCQRSKKKNGMEYEVWN